MKMRRYNGTDWDVMHPETNVEQLVGVLPVEKGGTGATTAEEARANLEAADINHIHEEYLDKDASYSEVNGSVDFHQGVGFNNIIYVRGAFIGNGEQQRLFGDTLPDPTESIQGQIFFLRNQ